MNNKNVLPGPIPFAWFTLLKTPETIILLLILLFFFAVASGQSGKITAEPALKVVRYGKEISLEKNNEIKITDLNIYYEKAGAYLAWNTKSPMDGGVYVIMQSQDGINYTYCYLIPSSRETGSHKYKLGSGNARCFYQVLHISNDNRYVLSDRKYPASYYASSAF